MSGRQELVGDRALGGAVDVRGASAGLLQASTYLGDAGRWPTPPLETSASLIRAGQLRRPRVRGVPTVLSGGLGWLLELTQGRPLCTLGPLLLATACLHHCGWGRGAAETMLVRCLDLGVRDLQLGRGRRRGRAEHLPGLLHPPALSALGPSGIIGLQGHGGDCLGL